MMTHICNLSTQKAGETSRFKDSLVHTVSSRSAGDTYKISNYNTQTHAHTLESLSRGIKDQGGQHKDQNVTMHF